MSQDMNINALRTNCFRQSKVKGEYMLQMRVPGGLIQAKYLSFVEHLAEAYGDGTFHFGSRQCFAIPGIKYENIDAVNKELKDYLENGNIKNSVNMPSVSMPRSGDFRVALIHRNIPAMLTKISVLISDAGMNIENLTNKSRQNYAYTMIDLKGAPTDELAAKLRAVEDVIRVTIYR